MERDEQKEINEAFRPFLDRRGVIIFKNPNEETHPPGEWGGVDSTQHCFSYLIYTELLNFFNTYQSNTREYTFVYFYHTFYLGKGKLRRYWEGLFSNPNNMSRDNTIPFIVACGMYGYAPAIKECLSRIKKRFWFYPNTHNTQGKWKFYFDRDYAFPRHRGVYYRALLEAQGKDKKLKRKLFWCDLDLYLNTVLYCFTMFDSPETTSDLNLIHMLIQSERIHSTYFSRLACKHYVKHRTLSTRIFPGLIPRDHNILNNIRAYYRSPGYDPPIDRLACPVIKKYLIDKYEEKK